MDYRDIPHKDYDPNYDPDTFEQQLHEFEAGIDPLEPEEVRRDRQEFQSRFIHAFSDVYRRANHYGLNWGNIIVIELEGPNDLAQFIEQLNAIADSDEGDNPTLTPNDQQLARYVILITWHHLRQLYPRYHSEPDQNIDIKSLQLDILADERLNYLSQAKVLAIIAGLTLDGEGINLDLLRNKRALEQAITKHQWEMAIDDEIASQAETSKSSIFDSINEYLSEHPLPMHDDIDAKVLNHIEFAIDRHLKGYREQADQAFTRANAGAIEIGVNIIGLIGFIDYLLGRSDDTNQPKAE